MFAYCNNNPVNGYDLNGNWVIGIGYSGEADFGVGGSTGRLLLFDGEGNAVIIGTGYYGGGTPNLSAGVSGIYSSADNVFEYVYSTSATTGGSLSLVGISTTIGSDSKGDLNSGFEVSLSASLAPAELHAGMNYSFLISIEKYHGKKVPADVTMDWFSDCPEKIKDMIKNQLNISA